jgi:hypothetical protein
MPEEADSPRFLRSMVAEREHRLACLILSPVHRQSVPHRQTAGGQQQGVVYRWKVNAHGCMTHKYTCIPMGEVQRICRR